MDDIEQCVRKSDVWEQREDPRDIPENEYGKKNNTDDSAKQRSREYENVDLSNKCVPKIESDLEKDEISRMQTEKEITKPISRTATIGITVGIGVCMILLPVSVFVWNGIRGLSQFRWILLAVEFLFVLGIAGLFYLRSEEKKEDASSKDNKTNVKKKTSQSEEFFGWSSFPDKIEDENSFEDEDFWEIPLRDSDEEEEEIQTVLLCSRPVYKECRKLVSANDRSEIPVGYFPFLIGKNRDLTDHCLNKPGVSRLHVKLEESENGYTVTDLNSTNGTAVNGRVLEANETAPITPGDELMIARERFYFR